jgi:hypothetical protein
VTDDPSDAASGHFDHHGWWINAGSADPDSVVLASAHESNHRQLQHSTAFGAVTIALHRLGTDSRFPASRAVVGDMVRSSETIHEAFATWASLTSLARSRDELTAYPLYVRHWDAMQRCVKELPSPYLRLHAAHAIARACMQAPVAEIAVAVGLNNMTLADLSERLRPDYRFRLLRRHGTNWQAANPRLDAAAEDPEIEELIAAPSLTAELFGSEHHERWEHVNTILYDHIATVLASHRCPTIAYDGHLGWTRQLLGETERLLGRPIDLLPGNRREQREVARVVLRNVEAEGFSNGPLLRARQLPSDTPVAHLVAATGHDSHLFLTIRPAASQTLSYNLPPDDSSEASAMLRRTVIDDDGAPTVELLDVSERVAQLSGSKRRIVSLIALSAVNSRLAATLGADAGPSRAVLMMDVSLGAHLDVWLRAPGAQFGYTLLRTESFGRRLPILVGRIRVGGAGESHLLVRPLSDAAVRIHKAALDALAEAGAHVVVDHSILEDGAAYLPLVLAHLAGEETRFPAVDKERLRSR